MTGRGKLNYLAKETLMPTVLLWSFFAVSDRTQRYTTPAAVKIIGPIRWCIVYGQVGCVDSVYGVG